jgi:hypothetical protein
MGIRCSAAAFLAALFVRYILRKEFLLDIRGATGFAKR